jgi:hypothetical protein
MERDSHCRYADETRTGIEPSFREWGRALVAARADGHDDFDWLARIRRDHLPGLTEVKSQHVLELTLVDSRVRTQVIDAVRDYSIFVVDLQAHYSALMATLRAKLSIPLSIDPIAFLAEDEARAEVARAYLDGVRAGAVFQSTIPVVENMLRSAMQAVGLRPSGDATLVDRRVLLEMGDREFKELLVRFAVALGDAMDPRKQADFIAENGDALRFWSEGQFCCFALSEEVGYDLFLDKGTARVFRMVEDAHGKIVSTLDEARRRFFISTLRGGKVVEEDSRLVLGIQAADVAAAIASREYQKHPEDRLRGAHGIRAIFSRVLWNTTWL